MASRLHGFTEGRRAEWRDSDSADQRTSDTVNNPCDCLGWLMLGRERGQRF